MNLPDIAAVECSRTAGTGLRRALASRVRSATDITTQMIRKLSWPLAVFLAVMFCGPPARAGELAIDHPFVGTWKLAIAQLNCTETYVFLRDGTSHTTSSEEISESHFEIAQQPSARGFYRWTDTIVHNNGKKDCSGNVTKPGRTITQYVLFHHSRDIFFICREESRAACFGPFVRQRGQEA